MRRFRLGSPLRCKTHRILTDAGYEEMLRRSLACCREQRGADHEEVMAHFAALAAHLKRMGKVPEARECRNEYERLAQRQEKWAAQHAEQELGRRVEEEIRQRAEALAQSQESALQQELEKGLGLVKAGRADEGLTCLRRLVFPDDGLHMNPAAPIQARIGFIVALMLLQHADGAQVCLNELRDEDHPRVAVLRRVLQNWNTSLSFAEKCGLKKKRPILLPPLEDMFV
jgi:hypothetical protein